MSKRIKQPKIEYEQLPDNVPISRLDKAFFLLFEETMRIRRLKNEQLKNKTYPLSPSKTL